MSSPSSALYFPSLVNLYIYYKHGSLDFGSLLLVDVAVIMPILNSLVQPGFMRYSYISSIIWGPVYNSCLHSVLCLLPTMLGGFLRNIHSIHGNVFCFTEEGRECSRRKLLVGPQQLSSKIITQKLY